MSQIDQLKNELIETKAESYELIAGMSRQIKSLQEETQNVRVFQQQLVAALEIEGQVDSNKIISRVKQLIEVEKAAMKTKNEAETEEDS